tara:strand:+ start:368 stop:526 length:159 start_codon:yes stop_codon:yes gene_type:complete
MGVCEEHVVFANLQRGENGHPTGVNIIFGGFPGIVTNLSAESSSLGTALIKP